MSHGLIFSLYRWEWAERGKGLAQTHTEARASIRLAEFQLKMLPSDWAYCSECTLHIFCWLTFFNAIMAASSLLFLGKPWLNLESSPLVPLLFFWLLVINI